MLDVSGGKKVFKDVNDVQFLYCARYMYIVSFHRPCWRRLAFFISLLM